MSKKVTFKKNGLTKQVKYGYSWTTALFCGWPQLLFRDETGRGIFLILVNYVFGGFFGFIWGFFANKESAQKLLKDGWVITSTGTVPLWKVSRGWEVEL